MFLEIGFYFVFGIEDFAFEECLSEISPFHPPMKKSLRKTNESLPERLRWMVT